jgi:hypothetical protein
MSTLRISFLAIPKSSKFRSEPFCRIEKHLELCNFVQNHSEEDKKCPEFRSEPFRRREKHPEFLSEPLSARKKLLETCSKTIQEKNKNTWMAF